MPDHACSTARPVHPPSLRLDNLASAETPLSEDEVLLESLKSLTTARADTLEAPRDQFHELYGANEGINPLALPPLPELKGSSRRPRESDRRPVVLLFAIVMVFAGTATAYALSGEQFDLFDSWTRSVRPRHIIAEAPRDLPASTLSPLVSIGTPFDASFASIDDERDAARGQSQIEPRDGGGSAARGHSVRQPRRRTAVPRPARPVASSSSERTPTPHPTTSSRPTANTDELDNIVDSVVGSVLAPQNEPLLPPTPSRSSVLTSLRAVSPAVSRCGLGQRSQVSVDVTLNGRTGRVTSARVTGADSATTACVQRAVGRARFDRFDDSSFTISRFPFVLR